ncbi:hypothetical protein D3C78_1486260 [compost metagenome]
MALSRLAPLITISLTFFCAPSWSPVITVIAIRPSERFSTRSEKVFIALTIGSLGFTCEVENRRLYSCALAPPQ